MTSTVDDIDEDPRGLKRPLRSGSAAVLTPPGRGAVAVIRVIGDPSRLSRATTAFRPANGKRLDQQRFNRVIYGVWGDDVAEDVVVCRIDEQTLEIHCHGGRAAARRILNDLANAGIATTTPADLETESAGLLASEFQTALSRTRTTRTADYVLAQAGGVFTTTIEKIRRRAETEWPVSEIDAILRRADVGRHLTVPWRVAVCGRPNVGKSSLINALVGYERAIVFDQPGTTRDAISATTALDGWPVELIDTAGIRETPDELEAAGVAKAMTAIAGADSRILLLDRSVPLTREDRELLGQLQLSMIVLHKIDLPPTWAPGDLETDLPMYHVSSKTGAGLPELQSAIATDLVPTVPPMDAAVPVSVRQCELLRLARDAAQRQDRDELRNFLDELIS